jgi:hypothetical protein
MGAEVLKGKDVNPELGKATPEPTKESVADPSVAEKLRSALGVGGTITSKNLPAEPKPSPVLSDDDIIAKPLVDADWTKLKPRNPQHALYFGNRVANGGMRIEDLLARGFAIAKPEQVLLTNGDPLPASSALIKDGRVQRGDLLLLIIDRATYVAALKYNQQNADKRVSKQAVKQRGDTEIGGALKEVGGLPGRYKGKIQTYTPSSSEVDNR